MKEPGRTNDPTWHVLAEWGNDPQWIDDRQRVEVRRNDGQVSEGTLIVRDSVYDPDDEEVPIFVIVLDDENETEISMKEVEAWRLKS